MSTIALIPARGGSKRLPRKNILELGGLPMIAYPIKTVQASGLFDRCLVSTEDPEIAAVARRFGAEVLERPQNLAQDHVGVDDVCLHAIETVPKVTLLCCVYATAVLLKPGSLVAGYALLDEPPEADYVMGVSQYSLPPVQALKTDEKGYLSYMWPEWRGVQSQGQPHLVVSNGCFYWARASALRQDKTLIGRRLKGYLVSPEEVSDINTLEDLELARRLLDVSQ